MVRTPSENTEGNSLNMAYAILQHIEERITMARRRSSLPVATSKLNPIQHPSLLNQGMPPAEYQFCPVQNLIVANAPPPG